MFYLFRQNNSGGYFRSDVKNGLGVFVIIEANNYQQANKIAVEKGIYFDGVEKGLDCDCCGDRWYEHYREKESYNDLREMIEEECSYFLKHADYAQDSEQFGYIHFLDGKIINIPDHYNSLIADELVNKA